MSDISGAAATPGAAAAVAAAATPDPAAAASAVAAATPDPAIVAAAAAADPIAVKAAADKAAADAVAKGTPGNAEGGNADDAPTGAPETYETFSLPEGMEMNNAQLEVFLPIAKDLNLTQEQAQKLVSLDAEQKVAAAQAQQQATDDMLDEWRETTKTDPEIGGANLQQSLAHTNTFLNKFASPALRQLLDDTGVGNNIEVIRLFATAGKAMGEDGVIGHGGVNPAKKSHAELLYPNQPI